MLGDINTVTAFRLSGVLGVVTDRAGVYGSLKEIARGDGGIVLITRDLAETVPEYISSINLTEDRTIILEIPAIDDVRGFSKSLISYISEALGISI